METQLHTRYTLIARVQEGDPTTWDEFVQYYKSFIYAILHKINIPIDLMDDAVQEILLNLWKNLPKYSQSKGKFRTWFGMVIHNQAITCLRKNVRQDKIKRAVDDSPEKSFVNQNELEEIIMKEWQSYLSDLALERMQSVFSETAVESFVLSSKGHSGEEIAEMLNISIHTVYSNSKRIKKRMVEEMKLLISELEF